MVAYQESFGCSKDTFAEANEEISIQNIINKLEKKSQTTVDLSQSKLIQRVKEISEKETIENSKQLMEILKQELSSIDYYQVDEIYKELVGDQNTKDIGNENVLDGIEKNLNAFENFLNKFDNASEIFDKVSESKGGITGFFAGTIAFIGYFLFGKLPDGVELSWIKKVEVKTKKGMEETKGKVENILDKTKNIKDEGKYILSTKLLLGFSQKDANIGYDIFKQDKIRSSSFNQLFSGSFGQEGLGEKYGLPGKDKDIYDSLLILKDKEEYIDKIIGKNLPNWRDKSIEELIGNFYKYIKPFEKSL